MRPANVFAYIFGIVSAIIMGCGMSLVMTDIGAVIGKVPAMVIGIVLVCLAYPIYNRTLKKEREKIASEILRLTYELMK